MPHPSVHCQPTVGVESSQENVSDIAPESDVVSLTGCERLRPRTVSAALTRADTVHAANCVTALNRFT